MLTCIRWSCNAWNKGVLVLHNSCQLLFTFRAIHTRSWGYTFIISITILLLQVVNLLNIKKNSINDLLYIPAWPCFALMASCHLNLSGWWLLHNSGNVWWDRKIFCCLLLDSILHLAMVKVWLVHLPWNLIPFHHQSCSGLLALSLLCRAELSSFRGKNLKKDYNMVECVRKVVQLFCGTGNPCN